MQIHQLVSRALAGDKIAYKGEIIEMERKEESVLTYTGTEPSLNSSLGKMRLFDLSCYESIHIYIPFYRYEANSVTYRSFFPSTRNSDLISRPA